MTTKTPPIMTVVEVRIDELRPDPKREACAICGDELWSYTPDGTGVCETHSEAGQR